MQTRREFLQVAAGAAGAASIAGMETNTAAAEAAGNAPPTKSELLDVLKAVGKPVQVTTTSDGTTVLILPYGGRVLGLYAPGSEENFYWTHDALRSVDAAKAFYNGDEWKNSGGDRTWLAPEVDIFLPKFPDLKTYWQPRELDPGDYKVEELEGGARLVNRLMLRLSRSQCEVELRMTKRVGPAPNPLRYERGMDLGGVQYAGYTLYTGLDMLGDVTEDGPMVGLWNLIQMPHQGELLIPVYGRTEPRVLFGDVASEYVVVGDRLIRYKMRAKGEHKLGVRAVATTGRVGYWYETGGSCALVIRNFGVNPSGEYVDVPWKDTEDFGYSTQACNVNSGLGAFSELEYHAPAIGGKSGRSRCEDAAQTWAFRGPRDKIRAVAHCLLSSEA